MDESPSQRVSPAYQPTVHRARAGCKWWLTKVGWVGAMWVDGEVCRGMGRLAELRRTQGKQGKFCCFPVPTLI